MGDLQRQLKQRFPLLTSLSVVRDGSEGEDLSAFMGILLAAMEGKHDASFCFVFPRKEGIAPLSAILYALGRFAVDFPALAEAYARNSFHTGENVRLIPEGKVYRFAGVWPGLETRFRLELLSEKAALTWPVSEILRIEPTLRKVPRGSFADADNARKQVPLSTFDRLIGTSTFGNRSLAVNRVLYLGGRAEVETFLNDTFLSGRTGDVRATVADLIVPGSIDESGTIRHQDNYQASGEPLVAITSRLDHIAAACALAPEQSKVVVVDGARRITDLAKFDSIAQSQNLIIVAEPDEEEKLQQLHDRGCHFWRFSLADLEMGTAYAHSRYFDGVFRSARNEAAFKTDVSPCRNHHVEQIADALEACQASLDESEGDETHLILGQIYSLLMHCAGLLAPPAADDRARLTEKAEKVAISASERSMWLAERSAKALKEACDATMSAITDPDLGLSKGKCVRDLLHDLCQRQTASVALVARSVSHRHGVMQWLEAEGLAYPVLLPATVGGGAFYEALVCAAWPNAQGFNRIVRRYAAPLVCLVGYPFECRWLNLFSRKQQSTSRIPGMSAQEKSGLLGLADNASWPADPEPHDFALAAAQFAGHPSVDLEERMTRKGVLTVAAGEETVPARLVTFAGEAYAFVTDTYRMPVITELAAGEAIEGYKVPRRRVSEIHPGDVLVFRETGRRDVIQALADVQLGEEAPAIRERAARWHKALRESGLSDEELVEELEEVKCPRTLQTVRGWLADDSMIGPKRKEDLEAIAYAVGDQQLLEEVPAIWEAIHRLHSEHLSAGARLSKILLEKLPKRLEPIQEGRTYIDIDDATGAWVVQVDGIAERPEPRPRSYVNALLFDSE